MRLFSRKVPEVVTEEILRILNKDVEKSSLMAFNTLQLTSFVLFKR